MKELSILIHLGLGDAIICNGLIRFYSKLYDSIKIPCYNHNYNAVSFMFRDDKKISVHPVESSEEAVELFGHNNSLKLGFYSKDKFDPKKFDQEFYRHADVPFSDRWDKFHVELSDSKLPMSTTFAFIHEDFRRGFLIRKEMIKLEMVKPLIDGKFFNNYNIMKSCQEIHCINSSFLHFWDSMPHVEGQKLFFHRYARPNGDNPILRKPWSVI